MGLAVYEMGFSCCCCCCYFYFIFSKEKEEQGVVICWEEKRVLWESRRRKRRVRWKAFVLRCAVVFCIFLFSSCFQTPPRVSSIQFRFFFTHSFTISLFEPFQALSFFLCSNCACFLCLVGCSLLSRFSYVDIRRVKRLWILNMGLSGNWVSLCLSKGVDYIHLLITRSVY